MCSHPLIILTIEVGEKEALLPSPLSCYPDFPCVSSSFLALLSIVPPWLDFWAFLGLWHGSVLRCQKVNDLEKQLLI